MVRTHLSRMSVSRVGELQAYIKVNSEGGIFDWRILEILSILMVVRRCSEYDAVVAERFSDIFSGRSSSDSLERFDSTTSVQISSTILPSTEFETRSIALLQFLNDLIATIEISDSNKRRRLVYFIRIPLFEYVSKRARSRLMKDVNRETQRIKILDLLERKELLFD